MNTQGHATYGGNKIYADGETIALTMAATMEQRFADAKRIAMFMNTHDLLVAELKDASAYLSGEHYSRVFHFLAEIEIKETI